MTEITLTIDRMTHGGRGIGRYEGKAVFVEQALPGEKVRVRLLKQKKRYAEGHLIEVLSPSPARIDPRCPVYDHCGGCQWQQATYAEQLRYKQSIFTELLSRKAAVSPELIDPIVPAPHPWAYRSRTQLKVHWRGQQALIGFYATGTHRVVEFDCCPVLPTELNSLLIQLKQQGWLPQFAGRLDRIDLHCDDEGRTRMALFGRPRNLEALHEALDRFSCENQLILTLFDRQGRCVYRSTSDPRLFLLPVGAGGVRLGFGPRGFAQINLAQNAALVATVLSVVERTGVKKMVDLYCGMGNFSLPIAAQGCDCVGVEQNEESIRDARRNAKENQLPTVRFLTGSIGPGLPQGVDCGDVEMVLLDPPRQGAAQVMPRLLQSKPSWILYVSCDPATLARDVATLSEGGYHVDWARPFDLFPQTWHVEGVVLLRHNPC